MDISDPQNLQEKTVFPGIAVGVATRNDTAFVALGGDLTILKILPSGEAIRLGTVATPGSRTTADIALKNNFAYMAYGEDLIIIDISVPGKPSIVGQAITPASARDVAVQANEIFVAGGGTWALQIYRNHLVSSIKGQHSDRFPLAPRLYTSYPNPFNSITIIEYEIPKAGPVQLKVFNSIGEEVVELVNDWQNAGRHRIFFDAKNLPTGVYVCRLRVNSWQAFQKMLIIK
jgi:hypothetical protein